MFEKGQYIIYGTNGVCQVADIGTMNMSGISNEKLYYTLLPVGEKDGKIFTPVDNVKTVMRPVLTKSEAKQLLTEIKEIDILWITDERRREQTYKEVMHDCDYRSWVRIIKTLYLRKQERIAEGKKVTASDEKYLRMAENILYSELSIALDIPKDEMENYIEKTIN